MRMIRLNKVGLGKKFTLPNDVKEKLRIHGILRASVPYTDDRIPFKEESSGKGYLLEYLKIGTLLKDIKTGQLWKFPNEVLVIVE